MTTSEANGTNVNIDAQKLMKDFQTFGRVVKETTEKGVDFVGRQYQEIEKKNPGFGAVLAKVGIILGTALSFLLRPFSTAIGFGVGLVFSKDVKALMNKVNEWFKNAGPFMKGLAVTGAVLGLIFTPVLGGFATGAYSGQKVADWMHARNQAQEVK